MFSWFSADQEQVHQQEHREPPEGVAQRVPEPLRRAEVREPGEAKPQEAEERQGVPARIVFAKVNFS